MIERRILILFIEIRITRFTIQTYVHMFSILERKFFNSFIGSEPPKYLVILFLTKILFWFFCETPLFFWSAVLYWNHVTFPNLFKIFWTSPTFDQAKDKVKKIVKKIWWITKYFVGSDPMNELFGLKIILKTRLSRFYEPKG